MKATLTPYLNFMGQTKAAMEFYHSVLGGKLTMQTFKEAGFPHDPKDDDHVIHASLENDSLSFMASDGDDKHQVTMGNNIHMSIVGSDETQLRGFFEKLADGGTVDMPLEKQFWGDIYGQLTDKFGVHWMVNITSK
jgi:PhnB protein